jgi:hypothetical protein
MGVGPSERACTEDVKHNELLRLSRAFRLPRRAWLHIAILQPKGSANETAKGTWEPIFVLSLVLFPGGHGTESNVGLVCLYVKEGCSC